MVEISQNPTKKVNSVLHKIPLIISIQVQDGFVTNREAVA